MLVYQPKGSYLVASICYLYTNEAKNKEVLNKLKYILDKNLNQMIPEFDKKLNWSIYPAIWHLDGVAKTIDNEKPQIKTPIDNLLFN